VVDIRQCTATARNQAGRCKGSSAMEIRAASASASAKFKSIKPK